MGTKTEKNPHGLTVGQKVLALFNIDQRRNTPVFRELTITKIGTRWVSLNTKHRFDTVTLMLDGGQYNPPGQVFLSDAHYDNTIGAQKAWRDLVNRLPHKRPEHLDLDTVKQIQSILNGELSFCEIGEVREFAAPSGGQPYLSAAWTKFSPTHGMKLYVQKVGKK